jgi:asparagine synthase (glutamine-hydrolysing)
MGTLIAVLNKKGQNATKVAVTMLKMTEPTRTEAFGIASPSCTRMEKTLEDLQNQKMNSHIIIGYAFSRTLASDKPQPIELKNATLVFEGRIYSLSEEDSDMEAVARKLQGNHEENAGTLIKESDGDFAFAVAEPSRLIAGRDAIGVRPLYYGENASFAALASERKTLWKIGIQKTDSFPPGHVAFVDEDGFKFNPVKILTYSKPKQITMQVAAKTLQTLLQHSVKERLSGLKEIAVAFSGGLDSSIIAFLAKRSNVNVHLIHVSLHNQPETDHAKNMAETMNLPIHIDLHKEEDVGKTLPKVIELIEEPDPLNASIGIPIYWAAEKAAEIGVKVMLAGQGADELFGGYKRYVDDYRTHGCEEARKRIFSDIVRIHETNLERDFKICNFHNIELRLPFATYEMAKFALDIPINLKIKPLQNTLRKLVLRQAAKNFGLPESTVKRPKKAIQYATGINKILQKLAQKEGLTIKEYLIGKFQETIQQEGVT